MHEASLMMAMVEQVEEAAVREGFSKVHQLRIEVGTLSGVDPSCLEFCFSEAIRGSVLEGAQLVIESTQRGSDFKIIDLEVD